MRPDRVGRGRWFLTAAAVGMVGADEVPPASPGSARPAAAAPGSAPPEVVRSEEYEDVAGAARPGDAEYVTSPENPWFARSFVNRTWSALVGEGFYDLADDPGPTREPKAVELLEGLANQFVAHQYDVRRLFGTIPKSKAYGREARSSNSAAGRTPSAANVPSRLRAIGLGAAGVAGLSFTDLMAVRADELRKRQRAVILLWMSGGPSQLDTFDPKPGTDTGGDARAIATAVPGIRVAHHFPRVAKQMGDIALIRSMTNKEGNHQRATYQLHTGHAPSGTVKHPSLGCVAAAELGDPKFDLPHIVSVGTRESAPGAGPGILGVKFEPFQVPDPLKPPLNVAPAVPPGCFARRFNLMHAPEVAGFGNSGGLDRVQEHHDVYKQTAAMVPSPHMQAFDVAREDDRTRVAHGNTPFGQGCLLARRLVEAGVTFVEVRSGGWDTHAKVTDGVEKNAGVDPGFATLMADLKARGMLDRTLVVWMGEFGRTPKINPNAGRDHFPRVFNVALAGGGVRGGQVVGASSADGTAVQDHPDTQGRPIKITEGGKLITGLFA